MNRFLSYLAQKTRTLRGDQRGNVIVFFAFALVPMISATAIAVDVGQLFMTRSKMQSALDAGALAGAQAYFNTVHENDAQRRTAALSVAKDFVRANAPNIVATNGDPIIGLTMLEDNVLEYKADIEISTAFGSFLGFDSFNVDVEAVVTAGNAQITEIVLALDNTSSMFSENRFNLLRAASKDFVNKMFNQVPDPTSLRISVVPWSATVNIKSERAAAANATPVANTTFPAAGSRLVPQQPINNRLTYVFNRDTGLPFFSNAQVNSEFAPVTWRGCISMAEDEREVDDDGDVEGRLTDAPPETMRWPVAALAFRNDIAGEQERTNCRQERRQHNHSNNNNNNNDDDDDDDDDNNSNNGTQAFFDPGIESYSDGFNDFAQSVAAANAGDQFAHVDYHEVCDTNWVSIGVPWCGQNGDGGRANAFRPIDESCSTNGQAVDGMISACVSDPNEFAYFASGEQACPWENDDEIFPWNEHKPIYGPQLNCPTAMLPLSSNRRQVLRKLDHMHPVPGGTHADIGLMWALRSLSPREAWLRFWGLSDEQAPVPYQSEAGRKIIILLTDGKNENAEDYEGYYGCSRDNRPGGVGDCWEPDSIDENDDETMDNLMIDACDAIKDDYEIELYTIAVDINAPESIDLLRRCATGPDYAFNIQAAELQSTFEELAKTNIRLIR